MNISMQSVSKRQARCMRRGGNRSVFLFRRGGNRKIHTEKVMTCTALEYTGVVRTIRHWKTSCCRDDHRNPRHLEDKS